MLLQVREEDDDENLLGEVVSPAHMAPTESIRELQQTVPSFREFICCDRERFRRPAGTSRSLCEIGCNTPPPKKKRAKYGVPPTSNMSAIHSMDVYLFFFFWKESGLGNINHPEPRQYIPGIELELFTYCIMLDHMMSSSIPTRKSFILLTFPPPPNKTPRRLYNHSPLFFWSGGVGLDLYVFIPEKSWPQLGSSNLSNSCDMSTKQLIDWWINSPTRSTSGTVVVLLFGSEIR